MTEAPKQVWIMPTRWAEGHGPDVDWQKGDWHIFQAKNPYCKPYVPKDIHDALVKAADELADEADAAIQNADRIGDYSDPMVSLPLSVLKDLRDAMTAYRKARGETQ